MRPARFAAGLAALLCLAGCGPDVANRDSRGRAIICFGDSLTQGVGATPGNDYPSRLARALGREVINAGVAGETSEDGLRRLERDVLSKDPRLVVVAFGGNDFLQRLPWERTFSNIDRMVERIQARGAMVVVAGVRSGLLGNAAKKEYRRIAKARRAALVPDLLEDVFGRPSRMADAVHPNDAGYAVMAERVAKTVKPLLEP